MAAGPVLVHHHIDLLYAMNIQVHTYSDSYKQSIIDLILDIQRNEFGVPITLEAQPDLKNIHSFYQQDNGNFWMAITGNKAIGTIGLLDIGNSRGALRKMFVHKNFRGKEFGIGQTLLNTLLEWANQKKFTEILLGTTEKFIAAQRFYEKNGFVEIEKQLLPAAFPVMEVDVKFYQYTVFNG